MPLTPSWRRCFIATAPAKARPSKSRCSKPWRNSCSAITWPAAASSRRSDRPAIRGCCRPTAAPTRPATAMSARWSISDKQWNAFFRLIGLDNEADRDPRLNSISARTRNYDFVYEWFSKVMKTRTTAEWMQFFDEADIPHAPLHDLDSLIDDPHLAAVGLLAVRSSTRPKARYASQVRRRPGARRRPRSGNIRRALASMARKFCARPAFPMEKSLRWSPRAR